MSDNVDLLVGRFRHLPLANEEPAHPLASYYCDECGEPDWVDTHQGGDIREFYADDDQGDTICEPCARLRAARTTEFSAWRFLPSAATNCYNFLRNEKWKSKF